MRPANTMRAKAAKMRSRARTGAGRARIGREQKWPKCDRRMQKVRKSWQNAIVRENGRQGRQVRMRKESKSCQNATVGGCERAKAAKMRPSGAVGELKLPKCDCRMLGVGKSSQKTMVRENEGHGRRARERETAKTRLWNAMGEQMLPKYDRTREQGAGAAWGMWKESKSRQNGTVVC